MKIEYAAILIKADAVRDILEEMIIADLISGIDITIIHRRYVSLSREMVHSLYPEWIERDVFPAMMHNLTQGPSLLLFVKGDDVYKQLQVAKGKMNKGGLRLKYRTHSIEEWQALGYEGEALSYRVAENRLHTTDDLRDTIQVCNLLLCPWELKNIIAHEPRLALAFPGRSSPAGLLL